MVETTGGPESSSLRESLLARLRAAGLLTIRPWVILYLGLCLGFAIWNLHPVHPWWALLAVTAWLTLARTFRWGKSQQKKRVWLFWSLIPIGLWWIYLYFVRIFGEFDIHAVFFHMQAGMEGHGGGQRSHLVWIHIAAGLLVGACFVWLVRSDPRWRKWDKAVAILLLASNPFFIQLGQKSAAALSNDTAWLDRRYVEPELVETPDDPPNLIVLYLESVERTYSDRERFGDVYDDLRALGRRGLVFEGIKQIEYTGWTMAGMVASQCGTPLFPAAFPQEATPLPEIVPGIRCLGELLSEEGYELAYMGGANKNFAGKGAFYAGHEFDHVLGFEELRPRLEDPDYVNNWGVYDDTLLDLALDEIRRLDRREGPYGFIGLTLAAHPPYGEPAEACIDRQGEFDGQDILYSVECSAWLARKFSQRLEEEGLLENTVVVVMSDHLAMKNSAWTDLIRDTRENTFILLGDGIRRGRVRRHASTPDLFPTLLEALGFGLRDHRAGLGTSLLSSRHTLLERIGEDDLEDRLREEQMLRERIWGELWSTDRDGSSTSD